MPIQTEYISRSSGCVLHDPKEQTKENFQKPCQASYRIRVTSHDDSCDDCLNIVKVALVSAALTPIVVPVVGTALAVGVGTGAIMLGAGVVVLGGIGIAVASTVMALTAAIVCAAALPLLITGAVLTCVL